MSQSGNRGSGLLEFTTNQGHVVTGRREAFARFSAAIAGELVGTDYELREIYKHASAGRLELRVGGSRPLDRSPAKRRDLEEIAADATLPHYAWIYRGVIHRLDVLDEIIHRHALESGGVVTIVSCLTSESRIWVVEANA